MEKLSIKAKNYAIIAKKLLKAGYCFKKFGDAIDSYSSIVLFRHDVDWCVDAAHRIACVEKDLGIASTYFFMLNSPFYNIFSKRVYEQIADISAMGHSIGFHLDNSFCEIPKFAQMTHDLFCQWLAFVDKRIVSVHRPGCLNPSNTLPIGCISTYDGIYTQDMKYFSDSGCKWRECPLDSKEFKEGKNIQLLLHPLWWVYDGENATEKFESFVKTKQLLLKDELQNSFSAKINWRDK